MAGDLNQDAVRMSELLVTAGLAAATMGAKPGAKVHLMILGDPPPLTCMFIVQAPRENGGLSTHYVQELVNVQEWVDRDDSSFYISSFYIAYSPACNQVGVFVPGLLDLVGNVWEEESP